MESDSDSDSVLSSDAYVRAIGTTFAFSSSDSSSEDSELSEVAIKPLFFPLKTLFFGTCFLSLGLSFL